MKKGLKDCENNTKSSAHTVQRQKKSMEQR